MNIIEFDIYMLNLERVSNEYEVPITDVLNYVDYHELKRSMRGHDRDLKHSLNVVERWLRLEETL